MPDLDRLIQAIDSAEEDTYGSDNDSELSNDRAYSIQLYLGENVDPAPSGRSQVVDRSVFETINWMMPSFCRIFTNTDLVSIPAIGPDDEPAAQQEAEYINWVISQQNPWFEIFTTWATDAMMTRNAYAMAYMDKSRTSSIERYERQTEEGVAMLLSDKDVEVITHREYPDEDAQPQPMAGPDGQPMIGPDGQPIVGPQPMLYDLELRRVGEKRKVCIKVLPPERCKVSHYTPSYRLADCDYFEYWDNKTISDLRAEGFDIADDIADSSENETEEDIARNIYEENTSNQDGRPPDPSMRRVRARMIWIRHDYDEDGIAEMMYVVRVGQEILFKEEVGSIPVASMIPSPLPHRHMGISITDMVADIQRIKSTILRQGLDNLYLSNNPQKVINRNLVNLDDVLVSIPGGVIRTDDVNAVRYEVPPFVFPQAMEGMEYMDQIRENRTGTNRYFTGIDQNAANKTASGIQTLTTMAAQRVEQIARVIGSSIEDLARIVHEVILRGGHRAEVVKMRGQWIEVDPSTWKKRTDFKIAVGFAAGNKDAMVNRLQMIVAAQMQAVQLGMPIVKPDNIYETMLELTKASDMSTPERFWTDPNSVPPEPPPPDPNIVRAEMDNQTKQVEIQMDQQQAAGDLQMRDKELMVKAEIDKYRVDKDSETRIALARIQGAVSQELESAKANKEFALDERKYLIEEQRNASKNEPALKVADQVQTLAQRLEDAISSLSDALQTVLTAKKQIRRGKSGRVEGVDIIGPDGSVIASQSVIRDNAGRVMGAN
jgi:hypothetical protein